ncbi:unnamed protein product [Leptosia nina]|uniref:Uncharacterized protein n=1 Tax=Leptosia nina TaxID=320188 RepID=A0AAV1JUB7_9NEOP
MKIRKAVVFFIFLCSVLAETALVNKRYHPVEHLETTHNIQKRQYSIEEYFNQIKSAQTSATSYVRKIMGTGALPNIIFVGFGNNNHNTINF